MIRVDCGPGPVLSIRGHARSAPYGRDVVCAAVSALAIALSRLAGNGTRRDGQVVIRGRGRAFRRALRAHVAVLREIESMYPECLEVKCHGKPEP